MIISGTITLQAPQDRVWAAIWDIPTLASWVPGCTNAEEIGEGVYHARLEQRVGFLTAAFDLRLEVVETEPPNRLRLHGEGEDRRLRSNVQVDSEVRVSPIGDGAATELAYRHDISVFGRLGSLGFPIIQKKAREIEAEFARRASAGLTEG